jgi:hypothetical protein
LFVVGARIYEVSDGNSGSMFGYARAHTIESLKSIKGINVHSVYRQSNPYIPEYCAMHTLSE